MDNAPASTTPPTPGAPAAVPPKKSGMPVFVWVLLGCGGLLVLGVLIFVALGFFVYSKARQAVDIEKGKVTLRGNKGETVTVTDQGEQGTVRIQSDQGTMTMGSGSNAALPVWLPKYPGSTPEGQFSIKTDKGDQLSCTYATKDTPAQVKDFYEAQLKGLGFTTKGGYQAANGPLESAGTAGQHADGRQVNVSAVREGQEETKVVLTVITPAK